MRYAIISDLHANLQAWNAVHLDLRSNRVDYTICLGDLVGYGPNPADVLQAAHAHVDALVLGNHDAVICGKLSPTLFNSAAQASIRWTRDRLGKNAVRFLSGLPLTLVGVGFRCAHGDFAAPGRFDYVLNADEALPSWRAVDAPLLFAGHTHDPALFLLGPSGIPRTVEVQDFALEDGKRYFVNAGSVGHPRDGDARASYCIYDTHSQAVFWRRVPFDLDAYRAALAQAGLDPDACQFLQADPRRTRPPLRERLCFSPPTTPSQAVQNAVPEQSIAGLRRRVRVWQGITAGLVLLAAAAASGSGFAVWRHWNRALYLPAASPSAALTAVSPAPVNLLSLPVKAVPIGHACPGWGIRLGNRHAQSVAVEPDASVLPVLVMSSRTLDDEMSFEAEPLSVTAGETFYPAALFQKSPDFAGYIAIVVSLTRATPRGTEELSRFYVKEPTQARQDGWVRAKQKFIIPAHGTRIQFQIRGRFRGTVRVKDVSMTRAERNE